MTFTYINNVLWYATWWLTTYINGKRLIRKCGVGECFSENKTIQTIYWKTKYCVKPKTNTRKMSSANNYRKWNFQLNWTRKPILKLFSVWPFFWIQRKPEVRDRNISSHSRKYLILIVWRSNYLVFLLG